MKVRGINTDKIVNHWLISSDDNYLTMEHMVSTKDYDWSLFMGHLVIEKLLKAIYVKKFNEHAIFTHDLLRLSSKIGLTVTEEQEEWLDKITTFNLNTRYDDYKRNFHKLCTKKFSFTWINRIKILRKWLKKQL